MFPIPLCCGYLWELVQARGLFIITLLYNQYSNITHRFQRKFLMDFLLYYQIIALFSQESQLASSRVCLSYYCGECTIMASVSEIYEINNFMAFGAIEWTNVQLKAWVKTSFHCIYCIYCIYTYILFTLLIHHHRYFSTTGGRLRPDYT